MSKNKKHLTKQEEFEIMKLVLDKFLLLGVFIMALGIYMLVTNASQSLFYSLAVLFSGAVILIVFAMILIKEYNFIKD